MILRSAVLSLVLLAAEATVALKLAGLKLANWLNRSKACGMPSNRKPMFRVSSGLA